MFQFVLCMVTLVPFPVKTSALAFDNYSQNKLKYKYSWRTLADVSMGGEVLRVLPRCRVLHGKYPSVALDVPSRQRVTQFLQLFLTQMYFKGPWLLGTTVGLL